jgi:phage gpG-like protein
VFNTKTLSFTLPNQPSNYEKIRQKPISGAFSKIAVIVSESIQRNFDEGGRYGGGKAGGGTEKWEPSKRVKRYGGKTLADTGRLRDSIGVIVSNVQNWISVKMEAGVEYGAIHQSGGRRTHADLTSLSRMRISRGLERRLRGR